MYSFSAAPVIVPHSFTADKISNCRNFIMHLYLSAYLPRFLELTVGPFVLAKNIQIYGRPTQICSSSQNLVSAQFSNSVDNLHCHKKVQTLVKGCIKIRFFH